MKNVKALEKQKVHKKRKQQKNGGERIFQIKTELSNKEGSKKTGKQVFAD